MGRRLDWSKNTAHKIALETEREDRLQKQLDYYDNKDYEKRLRNGEIERTKLTFNLTPYDQSILDGIKKPKQTVRKRSSSERKLPKQHKKRGCKTVKTKAGRTWIVDEFGCEVLKKEE